MPIPELKLPNYCISMSVMGEILKRVTQESPPD